MAETEVPNIKSVPERLKQYFTLTPERDKVAEFHPPYDTTKMYNDPGALNFVLTPEYRLSREDVNFLSRLPRVPKKLKTGDKMA